jgi:excisionase family DNA binding protein
MAGLQVNPPIVDNTARDVMMIERKTISIMKACEVVGVSRRTIYNWIASGKVEYVRTAGGSVRIFVDTLWREPGRTAPDLTHKEAS